MPIREKTEKSLYFIGGRHIQLFPIKYVARLFGVNNEAIRKKEERGTIPPAKFRSKRGYRLYSIDEIGMFEYLFKEVCVPKRSIPPPVWAVDLFHEAINTTREEVLARGRVENENAFDLLHVKYRKFDKYKAMNYIYHWRTILSDEED